MHHCSESRTICRHSQRVVQFRLALQGLSEEAVGCGIIAQLKLDVADAEKGGITAFKGMGACLVTEDVTQLERPVVIAGGLTQVAQAAVIGSDVVKGVYRLDCVGGKGRQLQAAVVDIEGFGILRLFTQAQA